MPLKVKKKLFLKEMPKDIKKNFSVDLKKTIADEIVKVILGGKSPVRSAGTFEQYSDSYSKQKGRKKPVDLLKSGKMLESIRVKQNKIGQLLIEFLDKKAPYHNYGQGRVPERKMLPSKKGERFNVKLTKVINSILRLAVKKAVKKQK
jgi:hypothetical protein